MSWIDQCKQAFKTKAEGEYFKKRTARNFRRIIRNMAKEINVPQRVLLEWWNELEGRKEDKSYTIPKCKCGRNLFISISTGKPLTESAAGYNLCVVCADSVYRSLKRGGKWTLIKS